jgi:hypothetical protein
MRGFFPIRLSLRVRMTSVLRYKRFGREFGQDVAGVVEVRVGEAELLEAVEEPGGADGFAEGWGGDADQLELPLAELRLVEVQPVEGAVNCGEGSEACDAALGGGGGGH